MLSHPVAESSNTSIYNEWPTNAEKGNRYEKVVKKAKKNLMKFPQQLAYTLEFTQRSRLRLHDCIKMLNIFLIKIR